MTPQQKMQTKLASLGIPSKEILCYGSQIMIKAWSRDAASKWATALGRFAKVRGIVESRDETKDTDDYFAANPGLVKKTFLHPVWLVAASI